MTASIARSTSRRLFEMILIVIVRFQHTMAKAAIGTEEN